MTTATSDIISEKIERAFDTLDADRNGYLEWSDYQSLVDRYLTAYDLDRSDRRARGIQAFCQLYWVELLRHAGVEGDRLTKEQFVTANRLASIDTSRLNVVEGASHAIFDCVDADGDNQINRAEFERYLRDVWRIAATDAMESFAKLDADGDGRISRQEFIRSLREYYHSTDPDSAGSLFFGHL